MTTPALFDVQAALREQMPVVRNWAYFDHAAVAPLPRPTQQRIIDFAIEAAEQGDTKWPAWAAEVEAIRQNAATLIGAHTDEIALTHSTTEGINFVAEGLDWRDGDNVVTLADEFPSNVYPWMNQQRRGVTTRLVATENGRIDMDELAAACDERTRLLSISWVGFQTGYRQPLAELCQFAHERGILFFVDAIQGLGIYPLDVSEIPIDFLAADGHKWLLGPEGAGVAYIRREHLGRLTPIGVGWNSVTRPYDFSRIDFTLKPTAARYEGGSTHMLSLLALGSSLKLLTDVGTAAIGQQIVDYTELCCERLRSIGAEVQTDRDLRHRGGAQRSGIVFFSLPGRDAQSLRDHCLRGGVALSCRGGRLRISPHAYNDTSDIERLVDVLRG